MQICCLKSVEIEILFMFKSEICCHLVALSLVMFLMVTSLALGQSYKYWSA